MVEICPACMVMCIAPKSNASPKLVANRPGLGAGPARPLAGRAGKASISLSTDTSNQREQFRLRTQFGLVLGGFLGHAIAGDELLRSGAANRLRRAVRPCGES